MFALYTNREYTLSMCSGNAYMKGMYSRLERMDMMLVKLLCVTKSFDVKGLPS
jgi:hypothetical protein